MKIFPSLAALLLAASSLASGAALTYDPPVDLRDQYAQLKARATTGDLDSIASVGHALTYGKGVEKNTAEGLKLIRMAAASGTAEALCQLEHASKFGVNDRYMIVVVPVDEQKSKMYRDKCYSAINRDVEDGSVSPSMAMGYARLHERGRDGIDENLERAKQLYDLAVAKFETEGDVDSLLRLAEIYTFGKAMRFEDKARGQAYMKRALATGHPIAWYGYAQLMEDENEVKSLRYLRKAAEAGHHAANSSLCYSLPDSSDEKIRWCLASYEQRKDESIARVLSNIYSKRGNQEEALHWGQRSLYNGNGYAVSGNVTVQLNNIIEFSGVRDIEDAEAHDHAWDSILTSEAYSRLYYRAFKLSRLCDKPIYDSEGYCQVKKLTESMTKPK